jgi:type IV secretory pathway TrbF-like protein
VRAAYCTLVAIFVFALAHVGTGVAHADKRVPLAVVVAKDSKIDSMSLSELRRTFDGDNPARSRRPFNRLARTQVRIAFDKKVLGLSPSSVGRYWIDRKVRGQRGAPQSLTSSPQVAKVVARFPGAIGYMRAEKMPDWVKAVTISRKSHLDSDYPLYVEVP